MLADRRKTTPFNRLAAFNHGAVEEDFLPLAAVPERAAAHWSLAMAAAVVAAWPDKHVPIRA